MMRYLLLAVLAAGTALAGLTVIHAATGPECTTTIQVGGAYVLLPVSAVSTLYGDITATDEVSYPDGYPATDDTGDQHKFSIPRLLAGVLVGLLAILLLVRRRS